MLALIALLALGGYPEQVAIAKADYAQRALAGENPRYLDCGLYLPGHVREQAPIAANFWMPHLSLGSVIEHQIGQELPGTNFLRIDIDRLGWGRKGWLSVAALYPYSAWEDPLIIRLDWFLWITSDETKSDLYPRLLFGTPPKNRADFLKALGIDRSDFARATMVALDKGRSGVAKDTRLIAHVPTGNGNHFETYDSEGVFGASDPLENIAEIAAKLRVGDTSGLQFQASELISDVFKESSRTGERCTVQVFALTDGQSKWIAEASTRIVEDYHKFKGVPSIRNPGSCVDCHKAWNGPAENTFRVWIERGVEVTATKRKAQELIESVALSLHGKIITRGNEDHEIFCSLAAGVKPAVAHQAFKAVVEFYDATLSPDQAAREVGARDVMELENALAYYSHRLGPKEKLGRFSILGHLQPVSRAIWEGNIKKHEAGLYHHATAAMNAWRNK